jgi:hypothetical protein
MTDREHLLLDRQSGHLLNGNTAGCKGHTHYKQYNRENIVKA